MDTIKFHCLKVTQPLGVFYVGVMNHEDLITITYSDVRRLESGNEQREVEIYTGIQRELSKNRVKEISKYVNMVDATFPTGVILHIEPNDIVSFDPSLGVIELPFKDNLAKVLDGQHRIAGLENFSKGGTSFQIAVTIFIGMELEDQAIVFATINKTQTKVNNSLVADLFDFASNRSPNKTAHNIIRALNQKDGSPFKNKIKILGTAQDSTKESITQATFADALMKLFSKDIMLDRDTFKRGKTPDKFSGKDLEYRPLRNLFIEGQDGTIAKIIWEYFSAVSEKWPDAWNEITPNLILNKSTGFLALMNLFRELYVRESTNDILVPKTAYLKYFDLCNLKNEDFNRQNFIPGSSGQSVLLARFRSEMKL